MENSIESLKLDRIIDSSAMDYYALCNKDEVKKIIIHATDSGGGNNNHNTSVNRMIKTLILDAYKSNYDISNKKILNYNYEMETTEDIYKFVLDESVNPVIKLLNNNEIIKIDDVPNIKGLFIEFNVDSNKRFYVYQEMKVKLMASNKTCIFFNKNDEFHLINKNVIGFDGRIDAMLYGDEILFKDPNILKKNFKIDTQMEKEVKEKFTELIHHFPCSKNCDNYLKKLPKKYKQKLLHIKEYGIVNYSIEQIKSIVTNDDFLNSKFKIENNAFVIKNENDFKMYISFFSDDIFYSKITNNSYISHDKEKCPS